MTRDAIERLNRYLDDVVRGLSTASGASDVDPMLVETVRRLHRRDGVPPPDPAFVGRLERDLMKSLGSITTPPRLLAGPVPAALNGRAPAPAHQPARRPFAHLATAALLVLTFGALFLTFGPGRPGFAPSGPSDRRVAILFVVDKSGSTSYDPLGGTSRIDLAKEAIVLAVQSLGDGDQVGVLVFNDKQEWIVPMTTIEGEASQEQIEQAMTTLSADGGTEIFPALAVGFDAIRTIDADIRHVVLISDGKSRTGTRDAYRVLIGEAVVEGVTLSTIAVGDDADANLMQFLAELGGGRYAFAQNPADLPLLTQEMTRRTLGQIFGTPISAPIVEPVPATPTAAT